MYKALAFVLVGLVCVSAAGADLHGWVSISAGVLEAEFQATGVAGPLEALVLILSTTGLSAWPAMMCKGFYWLSVPAEAPCLVWFLVGGQSWGPFICR